MSDLKKFRVAATLTADIEVTAVNEDEAELMARGADAGDFENFEDDIIMDVVEV